jgi:hypothetical protein
LVTINAYRGQMTRSFLARYVSPWALRRDKEEQRRVAALRSRDGDTCRRCRKELSFDLPDGHDRGARVERIGGGEPGSLDELCLCHARCNAAGADHTDEVTERIRRKSEAALLPAARKRKRKSA